VLNVGHSPSLRTPSAPLARSSGGRALVCAHAALSMPRSNALPRRRAHTAARAAYPSAKRHSNHATPPNQPPTQSRWPTTPLAYFTRRLSSGIRPRASGFCPHTLPHRKSLHQGHAAGNQTPCAPACRTHTCLFLDCRTHTRQQTPPRQAANARHAPTPQIGHIDPTIIESQLMAK